MESKKKRKKGGAQIDDDTKIGHICLLNKHGYNIILIYTFKKSNEHRKIKGKKEEEKKKRKN